MKLWKYSGAGNDFIMVDGRMHQACALCQALTLADLAELDALRMPARISELCSRTGGVASADGRIGADGLIILCDSDRYDFRMEFFNPDGSSGMMCGNGGRCIAAFADRLGIAPRGESSYVFEAADGIHAADIVTRDGCSCTVRLSMTDATAFAPVRDGYFVDTGARHFVIFVPEADDVDVDKEGAALRRLPDFAPEGTNVDFVSKGCDACLKIRTFEKGVEAETLACGTGAVAAAVAAYFHGVEPVRSGGLEIHYDLRARGGTLSVDFLPALNDAQTVACKVHLTGPAELVE